MVVNNSPSSRFISAKHIYYEIEFLLCLRLRRDLKSVVVPQKSIFSMQISEVDMMK